MSPLSVQGADGVKVSLVDARVSRSLLFDGGQLRLDPPGSTHPHLDEGAAINLVRSAASVGSASQVGLALVGLARATVSVPVTAPPAVTTPPVQLRDRLVWAVLTVGGAHSCPAMAQSSPDAAAGLTSPEPATVALVAADGSGVGVTYTTAGSFCGRPVPAGASLSSYHLSLPWRVVTADAHTLTIAVDVPACALAQGFSSTANLHTGTGTLAVDAVVFMAPSGCRVSGPGSTGTLTQTITRSGTSLPTPAPTGLNPTGLLSYPDMQHFTYFDGAAHTIP